MRSRASLALARRSIVSTTRQPQLWFPSLVFPMIFAALNSAAFERATNLPGFPPVDSFLDFMLATTIVQGVLFGSTIGGTDMAVDIQDGFFDRLVASPVARSSILVGRMAGTAVLGAVQALVFITVLSVFGASIKGGLPALVSLVAVAMVLAVGLGGFTLALALRTGSSETVQGTFPLLFIFLFLSSALFPRQLMSGWFKWVAGINPLSWMVEAMRHLVIVDFDVPDLLRALAVAAGLCAVSLGLAGLALRHRVAGP